MAITGYYSRCWYSSNCGSENGYLDIIRSWIFQTRTNKNENEKEEDDDEDDDEDEKKNEN